MKKVRLVINIVLISLLAMTFYYNHLEYNRQLSLLENYQQSIKSNLSHGDVEMYREEIEHASSTIAHRITDIGNHLYTNLYLQMFIIFALIGINVIHVRRTN